MSTVDRSLYIKPEGTPSPPPMASIPLSRQPRPPSSSLPIDPNDPENFLRRCCGTKQRTKSRCTALISQKTPFELHPVYLPTCKSHAQQKIYAGRCRFKLPMGEKCDALFRWTPLQLELCPKHHDQPSDLPCCLLKLPTELRYEIFRYLLPTEPIGSSTASLHLDAPLTSNEPHGVHPGCINFHTYKMPLGQRRFPMPLINLLLINQQINLEVLDLFYSITTFNIDIRKDGTFMCGRRLLEPCRADGTAHCVQDSPTDESKDRFLKAFQLKNLRSVTIDILLENWASAHVPAYSQWSEEVEIYDLRDYVNVVVSGILSKAQNLNKLTFSLCLADFHWTQKQILANTKTLIEPLQRLNNVRHARIGGIYSGRPYHNAMVVVHPQSLVPSKTAAPPICSIPPMPRHNPILSPGMPIFDTFASEWSSAITASFSRPVPPLPPIRTMFIKFKKLHSRLSLFIPELASQHVQSGPFSFMHRARVAREREDVETMRILTSVLTQYWDLYLQSEDKKKMDIQKCLHELGESDTYPHNEWVPVSKRAGEAMATRAAVQQRPIHPDAATSVEHDIPVMGGSSLIPILIDTHDDEMPEQQSASTPAVEDFDCFMTNINIAPLHYSNTFTAQHAQSHSLAQPVAMTQMQGQTVGASLTRDESMLTMQLQAQRVRQAQRRDIGLQPHILFAGLMHQQGFQQALGAAVVPPLTETNAEGIDIMTATPSQPSSGVRSVSDVNNFSDSSIDRYRMPSQAGEPTQDEDEIVIADDDNIEEVSGQTGGISWNENKPEAPYQGKGKGKQGVI